MRDEDLKSKIQVKRIRVGGRGAKKQGFVLGFRVGGKKK
jgi:hypothetical protein